MNRAGHSLWTLLLAALAVSDCALAAKLDKDTCAGLASELAALTATGIKADMERGPAWGLSNMTPERLQSLQRVLEIEDQLEFRCSARGIVKPKGAPAAPGPASPTTVQTRAAEPAPGAAAPAAPAAKSSASPSSAAVIPAPAAKPQAVTAPRTAVAPVTSAAAPAPVIPANPAAPGAPSTAAVGTTKSLQPTPPAVEPGKRVMAANPPPTVPLATPAGASVAPAAKVGPSPSAAMLTPPPAVAPTAAPAAPGVKKAGDASAQAARKKNPRRSPSNAYISPGDVSPFSLPGMR